MNTCFFGCLVQTFTQSLRILLRFCKDICPKNRPLGPLHCSALEAMRSHEAVDIFPGRGSTPLHSFQGCLYRLHFCDFNFWWIPCILFPFWRNTQKWWIFPDLEKTSYFFLQFLALWQGCYCVLVSWQGQFLSLNPCLRLIILVRMLFLRICL